MGRTAASAVHGGLRQPPMPRGPTLRWTKPHSHWPALIVPAWASRVRLRFPTAGAAQRREAIQPSLFQWSTNVCTEVTRAMLRIVYLSSWSLYPGGSLAVPSLATITR